MKKLLNVSISQKQSNKFFHHPKNKRNICLILPQLSIYRAEFDKYFFRMMGNLGILLLRFTDLQRYGKSQLTLYRKSIRVRHSNLKLTLPSDSLSPEVEDRPISSCGSVKSLKSTINEANEEFEDDPTAELQRLPSLTQTGTVFVWYDFSSLEFFHSCNIFCANSSSTFSTSQFKKTIIVYLQYTVAHISCPQASFTA